MATRVALRTLDEAGELPDNYVNPYYLDSMKARDPRVGSNMTMNATGKGCVGREILS